jgi:hypothetical protein
MKRVASALPPFDDDLSLHETGFPPTMDDFIKAYANVPA